MHSIQQRYILKREEVKNPHFNIADYFLIAIKKKKHPVPDLGVLAMSIEVNHAK